MLTKRLILFGIMAAFVLLCGEAVVGQVVYGQPVSGNLGFVNTHWKVTESSGAEATLNQMAIPLTGFVPLKEDFEVSFYVANASNTLDVPGYEWKLNGMADIRLQANHSFIEDQLLLSVGVNLPTGKKKLIPGEEMLVLQAISQNYLTFPITRLGEGFGFNILLGGAALLGENIRGGAGIMYQMAGAYEAYEGFGDYDPGDIISANAGVDIERQSSVWTIDAIYTTYTKDKRDEAEAFKQSGQFDMRLSVAAGDESMSYSGMARYVMRGKNEIFTEPSLAGLKMFGDEFVVSGDIRWVLENRLYFGPTAELRTIGGAEVTLENDPGPVIVADIDGATIFGFGGAVGKKVHENLNLGLGFKYFTGSALGGDLDLSGYQLTFGLSATM